MFIKTVVEKKKFYIRRGWVPIWRLGTRPFKARLKAISRLGRRPFRGQVEGQFEPGRRPF